MSLCGCEVLSRPHTLHAPEEEGHERGWLSAKSEAPRCARGGFSSATLAMDVPLFGGAISATFPQGRWLDASDVRPVPDHQEVWTERDGDGERSLIVEILERAECSDDMCAAYHFQDLAETNGAQSATVVSSSVASTSMLQPSLQSASFCSVLHGEQVLPSAEIAVNLGVVRLVPQSTDLLVSICRPCRKLNDGSTAVATRLQEKQQDAELLSAVLSSLDIKDFGLFG